MKAPYGRTRRVTKRQRFPIRWIALLLALLTVTPFTARAADPAAPRTIRILALGDSLTAGYGLAHADGFVPKLQAVLDAAGAHATVLDAGVSGDTSAGGLARLDWALGDRPDAAIVELGANDGLRGLDPAQMEHNLATILDRLAARRLPVLLSGMYAPPNLGQPYTQAFRSVFDRLSQRPGLLYDPFFLAGVVGDRALNQPDGMHPAPAGVDVIVRRITPLVLRLVAEARAQPASG
jgi:acyl-CoA thioesterase-1